MEHEVAFCENGDCRVELFFTKDTQGRPTQNCPNCGQYGRTKNQPKSGA